MLLAIETATAACSVALIADGIIVSERHEIVGRGHAERLVPMIADVCGGSIPTGIVVDCGPGSFTGVRVGLAAARALGMAWSVEIHGCSSLALIAAAADPIAEGFAVAIPGGHGELFVQRFACRPLRPAGALVSLLPGAAASAIPEWLVLGSGAAELIAARGTGEARERLPRAADVRLLPVELAMLPPAPIYGRAPDAKLPA